MKSKSIFFILPAFATSLLGDIPADRLPPAGYWNPGCIGTNGLTYRTNGTFIPPFGTTKIINVKASPYNAVGDGVHDDTTNIQYAIDSGGGCVIYLPAGTYKITGQLQLANFNYPWSWSSKILRGAGPTNTFIKAYSASGPFISAAASGYGTERKVLLAGAAMRGTNTIHLASWDGWGSWKHQGYFDSQNWGIIYETNSDAGPPWNVAPSYQLNCKAQIVHIIARSPAKTGGTITFDSPSYFDWGSNAVFTIFYGQDSSVGIEDLSIENMSGAHTHNIGFTGIQNSWIKNIESKNAYKWHIRLEGCARITVLDSYIHGYYPAKDGNVGGGDSVYGAGIYGLSTDCLVINNHFDRCRHAMICEYGDVGNVFAYNYSANGLDEHLETTDYLADEMVSHGETSWNLWEGNVAGIWALDDNLGGSFHNAAFRNNMTRAGLPTINVAKWGYDIQVSNYWASILGCVINNAGYRPTIRVGAPNGNGDWMYPGPNGDGADCFADPAGTPADPRPTLYVHGTVDIQTNLTYWVSTNSNHTLPASLWLTKKPSFWLTNMAWPAIGPDVSGYTNTIPAMTTLYGGETFTNAPVASYTLSVINGTGSGGHVAGTVVMIQAGAPPAGEVFYDWTGYAVDNAYGTNATLIMPSSNVVVTAVYQPLTYYTLTVSNGYNDDGTTFLPGSTVAIHAGLRPPGQPFHAWAGCAVSNACLANTTLIIPASNVTVTAMYDAVSAVSGLQPDQGVTNGLVAWWKFDEGSGTNFADSSGMGNNGYLAGSTAPIWASGEHGNALQFDGAQNYAVGGTNGEPCNSNFSISYWADLANSPAGTIISAWHGFSSGPNQYNWLLSWSGGDVNFNGHVYSIQPSNIPTNGWHNYVLTVNYANNQAQYFIDGVSSSTTVSFAFATDQPTIVPVCIGAQNYQNSLSSYYNGAVDDLRIYNRILSTNEIQAIYSEAVPPTPLPPPANLQVSR